MVRMNLILNAQRTMELELPNVDAKNGQIHDTLLTAVASTSLTDTSCCLGGTPWIPSGHHLPHERLGHQSNMQALGPKKISVSPSTNGNVRSHHRRTGRMNISEKRSLGPTYSRAGCLWRGCYCGRLAIAKPTRPSCLIE